MFAERCSLKKFGIQGPSLSMEFCAGIFSSGVKDLLRRRSPCGTPLLPRACSYVVALRSLSTSVTKNNNENSDQSEPQRIKTKRKGKVSLDLADTKREVKLTALLASIKNTIILFVCPSKILHKHCIQFLLEPL